ncbi:MAG: hypothetical protein ACXACY_25265 [Candidatus Hodarchaeales archaeon]
MKNHTCPNCKYDFRNRWSVIGQGAFEDSFTSFYIIECPLCKCQFYYNNMCDEITIRVEGADPDKLLDDDDFFYVCDEKDEQGKQDGEDE